MLVTLIGKNVLYKLILPHKKTGNYWITNSDDGKKLVNIIGKNNEWNIYSNEQAKILDPRAINSWNISKIVKNKANIFSEIKLQENGIYYISLASNPNMLYILLCEPTYERDFIQLNAKNFQDEIDEFPSMGFVDCLLGKQWLLATGKNPLSLASMYTSNTGGLFSDKFPGLR